MTDFALLLGFRIIPVGWKTNIGLESEVSVGVGLLF